MYQPPKITDDVGLAIRARGSFTSLDLNRWWRELYSVFEEIKLSNINHKREPLLIATVKCDGIYEITPQQCEVVDFEVRKGDPLEYIEEERLDDKAELTRKGFSFPVKVTLHYKEHKEKPQKSSSE